MKYLKYLIQRIRCHYGYHDDEYLHPIPPGVMRGIFGPCRCRCCGRYFPGFPTVYFSDLIKD